MIKKCHSDKQIQQTKENIKLFITGNEEQLTEIYCKSDLSLLSDVFEKLIKLSVKNF